MNESAGAPGVSRPSPLSQRERIGLGLLLLLAALLRLIWWHVGPKIIEVEGVEYARVAQNLVAGRGPLGLGEFGVELLYPPLYWSLMAAGIRLGLSAETAGRAVSLVSGIAFPLVCFWYTRRYLGRCAGWCAGVLAALHPLLILLSVAVLTESTYLTLVLAALYFMADVFALGRTRSTVLAGLFLGLSYLLRPEGLVLTFLLVLVLLVLNLRRLRAAAARAGLLLAVFALFALPYVTFLWMETGQLRFEAKTSEGLMMEENNLPPNQIKYGINSKLEDTGVYNTSILYQLHTTRTSPVHMALRMARQAVHSVPHLMRGLADAQLGSPILLMLAALGLFARPWDRARVASEAPLWAAAGLTLLTYASWPFSHDRFLYPVLPALVIWAGAGLAWLGGWAFASATQAGIPRRASQVAAGAVPALAVGLTAAYAVLGLQWSDELSESWNRPDLKDDAVLGRWLGGQGHPVRVMDTVVTLAFYAGDVMVPFPWTDADTALRYIAHKHITFLILKDSNRNVRPYLADWLRSPPPQLELVLNYRGAADVYHVYRWRGSPSSPPTGDGRPPADSAAGGREPRSNAQ